VQKCCAEMMSVSVAGIPKNRCRTTVAERMVETRAELLFTGDQVGLFRARPGRPKRTCNSRPHHCVRQSCSNITTARLVATTLHAFRNWRVGNDTIAGAWFPYGEALRVECVKHQHKFRERSDQARRRAPHVETAPPGLRPQGGGIGPPHQA